jgi:hypothetical protein
MSDLELEVTFQKELQLNNVVNLVKVVNLIVEDACFRQDSSLDWLVLKLSQKPRIGRLELRYAFESPLLEHFLPVLNNCNELLLDFNYATDLGGLIKYMEDSEACKLFQLRFFLPSGDHFASKVNPKVISRLCSATRNLPNLVNLRLPGVPSIKAFSKYVGSMGIEYLRIFIAPQQPVRAFF